MANDYISVNRDKLLGAELVTHVARLRTTAEGLTRLRDVMLHNIDGADYSSVEVLFGLSAGGGEPVYNMLNTCITQLGHTDVQTLYDRVGFS